MCPWNVGRKYWHNCTPINFDCHAAFKANILVSIETNVWMIWCETSIFMEKSLNKFNVFSWKNMYNFKNLEKYVIRFVKNNNTTRGYIFWKSNIIFIIQLCFHETFHSVFFRLNSGHIIFLVIIHDFREYLLKKTVFLATNPYK